MRRRVDTSEAAIEALRCLIGSWWPVALASTAAALAWLIAHRLLGHPQPFFAPIAAATALSTRRSSASRWRLRELVDAENRRVARLDLLANAVIGVIRATATELGRGQRLPRLLQQRIAAFAGAIDRLANTAQPWPSELRDQIVKLLRERPTLASIDA